MTFEPNSQSVPGPQLVVANGRGTRRARLVTLPISFRVLGLPRALVGSNSDKHNIDHEISVLGSAHSQIATMN